MKKALLAVAVLFCASVSQAYMGDSVSQSSFTVTNDSAKQLTGTTKWSVLDRVVVSSTSTGGAIALYDNTAGNTSSKIGVVDLGTIQSPTFNVRVSSGITYTTTGNTNGVTILWR